MQDYTEDLGLSRTFRIIDGHLSVDDTFEKLLQASVGGEVSKFSAGIIGTVIDSKYKVISLVGEGGMGAVYKVKHLLLNKEMALKTFRTANLGEAAWQRFQREAQSIAKLTHPNIVQVFDFGISEQNFPYYTMELLVGESLAERLQRSARLSIADALTVFKLVADGMAHAHRLGIVHRDIKPANIFIEKDKGLGAPRIVDFGLAKLAASQTVDDQSLTKAGLVFGSPLYMSPEQSLGKDTDQRTDIYSFGCSLFEALTGRPPFLAGSALLTISMHQNSSPPHLVQSAVDFKFPDRLEAIVAKLLAKNPQKRYQTFEEVGRDLAAVDLSRLPADASIYSGGNDAGKGAGARQWDDTTTGGESTDGLAGIGSKRLLWIGLAAVLLFGVLAVTAVNHAPKKALLAKNAGSQISPGDMSPIPADPADIKPVKYAFRSTRIVSLPEVSAAAYPDNPARYFVRKMDQSRSIFKFPAQSIGVAFWDTSDRPDREPKRVECQGQIVLPVSWQLEASDEIAAYPSIFRGFCENDLTGLKLCSGLNWDTKHFIEIAKLKALEQLLLARNRLRLSDLSYVDQLPHLTHLSLIETGLEGRELAQLKVLGQLKHLEVDRLSNLSPLFEKLQNSLHLVILSAKNSGVDDNDLSKIATNPNLANLMIDGNRFTARGLMPLARLPHLRILMISSTTIGAEVIGVLGQFPHLQELRIDTSNWSAEDKERLRTTLSKCLIRPPEY